MNSEELDRYFKNIAERAVAQKKHEPCDCEHCLSDKRRYWFADHVFNYSVYAFITTIIVMTLFWIFK
jgi:hypothetical protein